MKNALLWILAILITISAAIYQRKTGPTYDKKDKLILENKEYKLKLPRSHSSSSDCELVLKDVDQTVKASLVFRKYPTNDEWKKIEFQRDGDKLTAFLPKQPPAGKLSYYLVFHSQSEEKVLFKEKPVRIRFKGDVPAAVLIPHVILMFFAMLISNISGIFALINKKQFRFYTFITFGLLLLGGMIMGPVVQKYAFGEFWTGIPFGWDLTDNKTLIAFIFWILAVAMNIKKPRPVYTIIASIILLLIYSIPHSMFGSELDPETGKIIQGMIILYYF